MTQLSLWPVIWLAIILASIFCEAIFPSLVAVWFAPAALIALITGALGLSVWGQSMVFALLSALLITISRLIRIASRMMERRTQRHNSSGKGGVQ